QKHPAQMQPRQFIPPLFVFSLLGTGILALFSPLGRIALAMVLGVYLLANLLASILSVVRRPGEGNFYLPLAFSVLHLAYGFGFLSGLVRFAGLWLKKPRSANGGVNRDPCP
ncbi:MAG: hypothetical protein JXA42_11205, partial [Anaerolineales bacterium]|nr:hypothetical protein [Anaerolineales bacterium]